jgi:DNA-binding XRE family transcriptional regulator
MTIVNAPELTTRKCGVSLDTVSRIEDGESIPSLHVADGGANHLSPTF